MNNLRYLLLLSLLFAGCTKTENEPSFSYKVKNLHDVTMNLGDTLLLPLQIQHIKGTQEPVSLSVENLPNPILYWFTDPAGVPSFNTTLKLVTTIHALPGKYPAKIIATGVETGVKIFDLNLEIPNTVSNGIAGSWNLVEEGIDSNSNNQVDNKETHFPGSKKLNLTILPDHTGKIRLSVDANPATEDNISWLLVNNETCVDITKGLAVQHCIINKLAGRDMVLKTGNEWLVYRKQ